MVRAEGKRWIGAFAGTAVMAVGIRGFLEPAGLVAGGVTGIGIIIERLGGGIPLWLINIIFNLPLFFLALKKQGGSFVGKTMATSLFFSLVLFLTEGIAHNMANMIFSSLLGGTLLGLGMGLVLKNGATTGGVDLLAYLAEDVWKKPDLAGKIFIMDAVIIIGGMFAFGAVHGIYAVLAVFIAEKCTKLILQGRCLYWGNGHHD